MQQLLEIDSCRPDHRLDHTAQMKHIQTSVRLPVWQAILAGHPDKQFSSYVLKGLQEGFRIGFNCRKAKLQSCNSNMPCNVPEVVSEYLHQELLQQRIVKLSEEEANSIGVHCSPIGVIPKKHKPGKWRLIVDLSSPEGASVNDGVSKDMCSLSYTSVDIIAEKVVSLGQGTLLGKMDIKQAYRMVPVHPDDRFLLGMKWQGAVYVDKVLPFGLRSAPLIFTAVADALQWMMECNGVTYVDHYIDDYITVGRPNSDECARNLRSMHETCSKSGVPVEEDKSEGPSTVLTFLGIEIDTIRMALRLPDDKLKQLQQILAQWRGKKACRKKELQSIIGSLSHACKVVRPGRTFIRRLIDLLSVAKRPHHHIRLGHEARSDIEWWHCYATKWNGVSMLQSQSRENPDIVMTSDASGSWGCGAFCGRRWFQLEWSGFLESAHITIKELVPIVLGAAVWGRDWCGLSVRALCDNAAVVSIINWGNSQEREVMHLMRCLAFIQAKCRFSLFASHIKGSNNDLADALSRDNKTYFLSHYPQALSKPTPLPQELLDLTVITKPDWTSAHWTGLWSGIFEAA